MKLSKKTLEIFKNFSILNPILFVPEGNVLRTKSPGGGIIAKAVLDEQFPSDFLIGDVPQFINTIGLLDEPEIEFQENFLNIVGGGTSIRFFYGNILNIPDVLEHDVVLPSVDISFKLSSKELKNLTQAANVLQNPDLVITQQVDGLYIKSCHEANATANVYEMKIEEYTASEDRHGETIVFDVNNFQFIQAGYNVEISLDGLAKFSFEDILSYWVSAKAS
jgi:hypothetical protein